MKLLFFCSYLDNGGAEKHLVRVLNGLAEQNCEIYLLLTRGGGSYEILLNSNVKIIHLTKFRSSTISVVFSFFPFLSQCRKIKPDVIISVMERQNVFVSLIRPFLFKFKLPRLILMSQNSLSDDLNSRLSGKFMIRLIRLLYNRADKVIALSQGVRNDLILNFGVKIPVDVIGNACVDQQLVDTLNSSVIQKNEVFRFIAVGRLVNQKGFDFLLRAFSIFVKSFEAELVILGDGPLKFELTKLANSLSISDKVSFLGFKSNPYLDIANADVFILSSRWEGFANVIVESMACGTPVIASNCNYGPAEIICHGVNGFLFEPNNIDDLLSCMKILYHDESLKLKFVRNGIIRAKDFSYDKISSDYLSSIRQVI